MGENEDEQSHLSVYKTYSIVTLVGPNHIYMNTINADGKLKKQEKIQTDRRIIRFKDDANYKQGILLLLDRAAASVDFMERQGCKLYSFPYQENTSAKDSICLSVLKGNNVYDLLTAKEDACVAYDSYFTVVRANKDVFEKESDKFGQSDDSDNDDVRQAFSEKDYVKCVVCTSDANRLSRVYSIRKIRNPETTFIEKMRLIKKPENVKTIERDPREKDDDDTAPVSSFYITAPEYGEHKDSYTQISTS